MGPLASRAVDAYRKSTSLVIGNWSNSIQQKHNGILAQVAENSTEIDVTTPCRRSSTQTVGVVRILETAGCENCHIYCSCTKLAYIPYFLFYGIIVFLLSCLVSCYFCTRHQKRFFLVV